MTTLYVDADNGDDTVSVANNTASNPMKTLLRASQEVLSAGDTLDVIGVHSGVLNLFDDVTYDLTGAKLLASRNQTEDEGYTVPFGSSAPSQKGTVSFFQDWTLAIPFGWQTLGSDLIQDTVNFYVGDRSLRMESTAYGLQTHHEIPFSGKYSCTVGYKNDTLAHQGQVQFRATGGVVSYWTGTEWTTSNTSLPLPSSTEWNEHTFDDVDLSTAPVGTTRLRIIINVIGSSDTLNIQSYVGTLIPNWELYSGTTYKLEVGTSETSSFLYKCSKTAWASSNADALEPSQKGGTKDTLAAGEFIFDTDHFYYRLDTGETDIFAIHFEAVYQRCIDAQTNSNFKVLGGELIGGTHGVNINGVGAVGIEFHGTKTHKNKSVGFYVEAGEAKWFGGEIYDCLSSSVPKGEGTQCIGGTLYAEGVHIHNIQDDCFQPSATGIAEIFGCLMEKTFGTGTVVEFDIGCIMRNCTLIQNVDGLVVIQDRSPAIDDVTVENCIFIQNGEGNSNIDATIARTTGIRTVSGCLYYGSGNLSDDIKGLGASDYSSGSANTDALVDETTGELLDNSPAIGAGSKTWVGANPIGANGEPFSDFDTDKGANQSTHGPFHPSNL